jgi:hypothetical protein
MIGAAMRGFIVVAVMVALVALAPTIAAAAAESVAREFLAAIKTGDLEHAKRVYETKYPSLPPEGVAALFHYESAYQPNLAFLVRQPFDVASIAITGEIRSEWYFLDGNRGNYVTTRLRFEGQRGPFFLPVPTASGRPMNFVDFMNFVKHPARHRFEELTLRFRPSVAPGLISSPARRQMVKIPPPPVPADVPQRPAMVMPAPTFEGGLFGPRPHDPGPVVLPSGEALTPDQLAALLPRLRALDVVLIVMQRGRLASWKIEGVQILNILLVSHGVEIPLR